MYIPNLYSSPTLDEFTEDWGHILLIFPCLTIGCEQNSFLWVLFIKMILKF